MGSLADALKAAEEKSGIKLSDTVKDEKQPVEDEFFKKEQGKPSNPPTAPYNFVKLNDRVVEPPLAAKLKESSYADFIKEDGKYSGYFEVDVKNETPLYIAGVNGFFANGSRLCIPGSSLRGCLKNTFKIITNSAFRSSGNNPDLTDKKLYFRTIANGYPLLQKIYDDRMTQNVDDSDDEKDVESIAKAGFLVRKGREYYICPISPNKYKPSKGGFRESKGKFHYVWSDDSVEVHTGPMPKKKHFYVIKHPVWQKPLSVSENIINDYREDKTRKGINLLAEENNALINHADLKIFNGAEEYNFIVPCFYVAENNEVKHFGAGPYYRIPYNNSIGDHIPPQLKEDDVVDFADAVFGKLAKSDDDKESWSSRIFFEDLYLVGFPQMEQAALRKILSTPNPTSFQLYLNTYKGKAATWDNDTDIRGYKMYWHKNMDWQQTEGVKQNENMSAEIAPLTEGNNFKGRIRFENLDAIELGAICALFALGKEKDIAYKLGMGKPIGLGTIKLAGKLYLQSEDYYQKLFDNKGFAECVREVAMSEYVDDFNEYMDERLKLAGGNSLALYKERMRELRMIMSTQHMEDPNWDNKTRYMDINNKKDKDIMNKRIPLPSIEDVVK